MSEEVEDYNVIISDVLNTNDIENSQNNIRLFPNPVNDVLNITKVSDKAVYKIYSVTGQLLRKGNIINGKINVSSLIKSVYIVYIEEKGEALFKSKFIKK